MTNRVNLTLFKPLNLTVKEKGKNLSENQEKDNY